LLRLRAQDTEDLAVLSAHMQDALIRVSDIDFAQKRRRFALVANRYVWEQTPAKERRRSGLHFENVLRVKRKGFANAQRDTILSLLSITWKTGVEPSGELELTFAGGHVIALEIEYLDALLGDLGPAWSTEVTPAHES
jgi:Protein of unknown function (DUF2948)